MYRNAYLDGYSPYPPVLRHRRHRRDHYAHGRSAGSSKSTRSSSSWLDGKLKQGPTAKDVGNLQSTTASPATRSLTLSREEAFTLAEQALQGHVRALIHCMDFPQEPMTTAEMRRLPFKVFNEIDREFFRSMLKGNVSLGWSRLKDGVLSQTTRAGHNGDSRTRIELSHVLSEHGRRGHVFAELIHQMVHAYYLQCCGFSDQDSSGPGHGLGHGPAFLALLRCIGEHCEPLRHFLSPNLRDRFLSQQYRIGHRSIHNGSLANPSAGVSSCYVQQFRFNSVDIQDWRKTAVAKTVSLQEAQKPSSTSQPANDK